MKEAGEGGVAEANNTNMLADGRRCSISQRKKLCWYQPVSPHQPLEWWRQLWCFQFGLLQVSKLERLISLFAKKWLGLPRCFRSIGLYQRGILELPLSSLEEEFKCTKVRLKMIMSESCNACVAQTALCDRKKMEPSNNYSNYSAGKVFPYT